MIRIGWASALLCLALTARGASRATPVRFNRTASLPESGLRLRIMPGASEAPPPAPRLQVWRDADGHTTERADPEETWRNRQTAGRWSDPDGNLLVWASPTDLTNRAPVPTQLTDWAARWLARPTVSARPLRLRGDMTAIQRAWFMEAPLNLPALPPACLLQLRLPRRTETAWYLAVFIPGPSADPIQARAAFTNDFLAGIAIETGGGIRRDAPPPASAPPASREVALAGIRNLRDWWALEAPGYVLLSNLGARHRQTVRVMLDQLAVLRPTWERLLPSSTPIEAVSVLRVYADAADYVRDVGPAQAGTSGLWVPVRGELLIRAFDEGSSREQREAILRTVRHEASHQYAHYAAGRVAPGAWFNEGHAELFEHVTLRGDRIEFEEYPPHVDRIQRWLTQGGGLNELLPLSYDAFYAGLGDAAQDHYALAWGLVYWLRMTPRDSLPPGADSLLGDYWRAIQRTGDAGAALDDAVRSHDLRTIETAFADFWTSASRRAVARRTREPFP